MVTINISKSGDCYCRDLCEDRGFLFSLSLTGRIRIILSTLALFPGSPLAPTKNKNGGGEPGTDSHVM